MDARKTVTIHLTPLQADTIRRYLSRLDEFGQKSTNLFHILGIGANEIKTLRGALQNIPETNPGKSATNP